MKIDFSIIGAPKSGTTSIAYYLSQNPNVDFCKIKEPFYYNRKSPSFNGVTKSATYHKLYRNDGFPKGEGTTWYLYSEDAVDNILKENPNARFIVCVRHPADMVISWHGHMRLVGAETEPDFYRAWTRDVNNINKTKVYRTTEVLDYRSIFKIGSQVQSLLSKVDRQQILFVSFSEFAREPERLYLEILRFLNIDFDGRTDFPVKYPRVDTKFSLLKWLGSSINYKTRIQITSFFLNLGIDLYSIYFKLNTSKAPRPVIADHIMLELEEYFKEEIALLNNVVGFELISPRKKNAE